MKRSTPLRRTGFASPRATDEGGKRRYSTLTRTPMKRKKARRIGKRAALRPWLAVVAQRPCAGELGVTVPGRGWREHLCEGPIQVMHLGAKPGVGLKCSDLETGAGCMRLHMDFDGHAGPFRGWSRDERRAWADGVIAATQAASGQLLASIVGAA